MDFVCPQEHAYAGNPVLLLCATWSQAGKLIRRHTLGRISPASSEHGHRLPQEFSELYDAIDRFFQGAAVE